MRITYISLTMVRNWYYCRMQHTEITGFILVARWSILQQMAF